MIARTNQMEPVPRRIRAMLNGQTLLDSDRAIYLWEWSNYPQYIPVIDIRADALIDENREQKLSRCKTRSFRRSGAACGWGSPRPRRGLGEWPGRSGPTSSCWSALTGTGHDRIDGDQAVQGDVGSVEVVTGWQSRLEYEDR